MTMKPERVHALLLASVLAVGALELISARLVDKARAEHLVSIGLIGLVTVQILAWG